MGVGEGTPIQWSPQGVRLPMQGNEVKAGSINAALGQEAKESSHAAALRGEGQEGDTGDRCQL